MGVNMRNSEGYYDPTAYEALSNIEREAKAAGHTGPSCISVRLCPGIWIGTRKPLVGTVDSP